MKFLNIIFFFAITPLSYSQISVNILPSNGAPCIPIIRNSPPSTSSFVPRASGGTVRSYYYYPNRVTTVRAPRNKSSSTMRTFVSNDGSSVKARLISVSTKTKSAKIKTDKGKIFNVPISRFSNNDIAYMKNWYKNKYKK